MYDLGDGAGVGRAREHEGDKILLVIAKDFVDALLPKDVTKKKSRPKSKWKSVGTWLVTSAPQGSLRG
jgi:hypothetical protein